MPSNSAQSSAPLKQRYGDDPQSARIPVRAEAILDADQSACTIVGRTGPVMASLHRAAGGSGELACSADLLLESLVACAGVTLGAVATAMGVTVRAGRIIAEGVWDARGTLAIDRNAPVGVTDITLRFEIDSDAEPAKLERMIHATERCCVILADAPRLVRRADHRRGSRLSRLAPPQSSGRVQIQVPPISPAATGASDHGNGAKTAARAMLIRKPTVAAILPLREMARRSRHWRSGGPKLGMLEQPALDARVAAPEAVGGEDDEGHGGQERKNGAEHAEREADHPRRQIDRPKQRRLPSIHDRMADGPRPRQRAGGAATGNGPRPLSGGAAIRLLRAVASGLGRRPLRAGSARPSSARAPSIARGAGFGAEADLLGADEGDVGQADEAQQLAQIGLLEVDRLGRAVAVEAAAGLDHDDLLAGDQCPWGRLRNS